MAEIRTIADLLNSADAVLVLERFAGPQEPLPEPPILTTAERWFLLWCPPILAPGWLVAKRETREAWDGWETPRFRSTHNPLADMDLSGMTVQFRRPIQSEGDEA